MTLGPRIPLMLCIVVAFLLANPSAADVRSPADLTSKGASTNETSLGNLVADSVAHGAETQVALVPAGSFKEITIPAGLVAIERIVECLQYPDDRIAVLQLSGSQLRNALERSISVHPHKSLGFLQVAGISLEFNPKSPRGSRITSVKVLGKALDDAATYRVATTKPLAEGQYGYFTIFDRDVGPQIKDKTIAQAVKGFLGDKDSVDYRKLERIRALNGAPSPARGG